MKQNGKLYIVATPIGNLGDITLRAIETLKNVDVIACEDTRVSRKLLDHFDIRKPLISLHQHSSEKVISEIVERLRGGGNVAYITDGGTPAISDPGSKLIQKIRDKSQTSNLPPRLSSGETGKPQNYNFKTEKHIDVIARNRQLAITKQSDVSVILSDPDRSGESKDLNKTIQQFSNITILPIPGPSAMAAALSVSGLVEKEFYFAGFLPKKKGRQTTFKLLKLLNCPIVIYESPMRIEKTLKDIESYFGKDTEVFIAREMTKMFEEHWGGKISEVLLNIGSHKLKGEMVLIVKQS